MLYSNLVSTTTYEHSLDLDVSPAPTVVIKRTIRIGLTGTPLNPIREVLQCFTSNFEISSWWRVVVVIMFAELPVSIKIRRTFLFAILMVTTSGKSGSVLPKS